MKYGIHMAAKARRLTVYVKPLLLPLIGTLESKGFYWVREWGA
jgi:hypothetical protein